MLQLLMHFNLVTNDQVTKLEHLLGIFTKRKPSAWAFLQHN